jgi:hypothetical protein
MPVLELPTRERRLELYMTRGPRPWPSPGPFNRVALAAAHVVADPLAPTDPWLEANLDWEATLAYRRHLWRLGFGVAEATDAAQRGMGLDWPTALELIRRSVEAARDIPGALLFSGASTDHISGQQRLDQVMSAYEKQMAAIEHAGGRVILMASRALAQTARSDEDYAKVYDRILGQAREKVIIDWLGEAVDPALAGYWGHRDLDRAAEVLLAIVAEHAERIDGIKVALLDKKREVALRQALPPGIRLYTGDDFDFAELIAGDESGHSDALLGVFDAIAPAGAAALAALARSDRAAFDEILAPTAALARHVFAAPTRCYKTGLVFMAYLNGHQRHFVMIGGLQSTRSLVHLAELFRLADGAGLLADPDLAARRMTAVLRLHGVGG